jgi:dipeptidyl aminopeptidase/acylaminoacyl peptidase
MRNLTFFTILFLLASCAQREEKQITRYTIEQLSKNISISGGSFSEGEDRLLFSSNESGIFNVFELSIADGTKRQITNSEVESFFAIDYVPGGDQLLYSADQGGNERDHIYLLNPDGTSLDLTPGEREKASFAGWSRDKKYMYYGSNLRDPRFFDVRRMKVGEWKPEMIYENKEGLNLVDVSDDESLFILTRAISTSESKLYLMECASGQMTEISEPDAPGRYEPSGFNRAGTHYYYLSDAEGEFTALMEYEIASGARKTIYQTGWDVMYSMLSENEKYRVIAVNDDGKNNLLIINNETGEQVDFPQLEDGDIGSVRISDSEKLMRMTVGTSKSPDNLYVYDFETAESKKLTETLNPEINPDDLVSAEVVRYPSFDGLDIPAIFYKPKMASRKNKVPALVWVHGGPGGQSRVQFSSLIQFLVNHDYAILAVNNRGSSGYGKTFYRMDDRNHGDKDLRDCIWGKKWLQEQEYIDPEKIGIFGGSYGGFMVMAAMTFAPEEFKVGVNMFGVTNWLRTLKSIPPWWGAFRDALYQEMGNPYTEDSVRLYDISPLFHAGQVRNPIMVLQGANDPRVLQVESDEIVEAVRNNGVYAEYIIFPDEGHGFAKTENRNRGYGEILVFLDRYLKGEEPAGSEPPGSE